MLLTKTTLVFILYCSLVCFKSVQGGNGYVKIVDENGFELTGDPHTYNCRTGTRLTCMYSDDTARGKQIQWIRYNADGSPDHESPLASAIIEGRNPLMTSTLNFVPPSSGHYACEYYRKYQSTLKIGIILVQNNVPNGHCIDTSPFATTSTFTVSSTTGTTVTVSSTSSPTSSSKTDHFVGLNPLIYTTITALFLVILTLVAIITCWLRSRKMSSQRTLLPQETPQDYLDYIREGQFTPLTTSEFLASLHERPPTYLESEVIQRRMETEDEEGEGEGEEGDRPPPVPLRNMATTRRQETSSLSDNETSHDRSHDDTSTPEPLQDPSSLIPLPEPSSISSPEPSSLSLPDPFIDSSSPVLSLQDPVSPLQDPALPLQDPLVPLQDPLVPLQDPSQYNDDWLEDIDENAPLINIT